MNLVFDHVLTYSADRRITIGQLKKWEMLFAEDINLEDNISEVVDFMEKNNVKWLIQGWKNYHYKFNLIKSKPYIVYYKWNLEILNKSIFWIVWPRIMSQYAKEVLNLLFGKLSEYDVVTVSWMADGVDKLCHDLSIQKNIPTIAVLGWWFDAYFKSRDKNIIERIVDNWWLVLSEFKLFRTPDIYTFPQRNRIIAWLCDVLFLPEAGIKSWSLITADFASQMNKPIYWTPNSIFSQMSQWLHSWITDWKIKLIYDFDIFLNKYFDKKLDWLVLRNDKQEVNQDRVFSEKEQKILTIFSSKNEISMQELLSKTWLEMSDLMMTLTMLEMDTRVVQSSPWMYKKK